MVKEVEIETVVPNCTAKVRRETLRYYSRCFD